MKKHLARMVVVPVAAITPLLALPIGAHADDGATTSTPSSPPSSEAKSGGVEIVGYLERLISKVEKSSIAPDVKDSLLGRLRSAREAFKNLAPLSNADVQALLRDTLTALGTKSTDAPATTVPPVAPPTSQNPPPAPPSSTVGSEPQHHDEPRTSPAPPTTGRPTSSTPGGQAVGAQLDEWVRKINGSSLSDAEKTTLLTAIDHLRSEIAGGTLNTADLALVKAALKAALEKHGSGDRGGSTTTVGGAPGAPATTAAGAPSGDVAGDDAGEQTTTSAPGGGRRARAHEALDSAIATVGGSNLPDAVKQQILDVLNQAKTTIDDDAATPEQTAQKLHDLFEAEKAKHLQEAATRLADFAMKIAGLAVKVGEAPGSADVVSDVKAKIEQASTLLAGPLDVKTLKAAWKLLHDARKELGHFIESAATTTTADPTIA